MVLGERGYWFELPRSAVEFKEKLGEGAFGEVFKGVVRIGGQFKNCAVKKLKGKWGSLFFYGNIVFTRCNYVHMTSDDAIIDN